MARVPPLTCVLLLLCCATCGCGTLCNMTGQNAPLDGSQHAVSKRIYGGVRIDAESTAGIARAAFVQPPIYESPLKMQLLAASGMSLWVLDLPLSAAADTLTLPATLSASLNKMAARPAATASATPDPSKSAASRPDDACSTWRPREEQAVR
jgi:uncharacterized protein YceK